MLTPLELDIMKAVWHHPPITVREVQDAIRPSRQLAYTTVMTIMDRLYHKGFLRRTLQARTHHYESAIDYTHVRDQAVETLVRSFFGSKEKLKEFLDGQSSQSSEFAPKPIREPVAGAVLDETLL
jgi:predicted transcriptional regulator